MDAGVGESAAVETGAKGAGEAVTAEQTAQAAVEANGGAVQLSGPGMVDGAVTGADAAGNVITQPVDLGAANAGAAGPTGGEALQVAKAAAPVVGAAASLMNASATVDAAKAAVKGVTPAVAPPLPQAAIDPDLTAIRKKNALLFGLDSPSATDITGGKAGVGNVARATLLGGSSSLGA